MVNSGITVLTGGRLLDCTGEEPLEDFSVVVEGGDIKDIYPGKKPLPEKTTVIDAGGRTIMPGLTDAHVHIAYSHPDLSLQFKDPPIVTALWMKDNCERILQAGFTTVCDMGLANRALKQAIEDGLIKGPRLLICNTWLTRTGGHIDRFNPDTGISLPRDTGLYSPPRIVDGVDDARKAAREQLRAGADFLKVLCGGSVAWPHAEFSEGELTAFAEEASDVGKYVHAHDEGFAGAKRALKCGARVLHHVFSCDDEIIRMMKAKNAFHVPTFALRTKGWLERADEIPWTAHTTAIIPVYREALPSIMRTAERIFKSGCSVGSGSDCLAGIPLEGWEIKLKTECGMTPYQAIKSATAVNARIFQMEDRIGTIEAGKWADIIVVDGHPDEDPEILADPNNVRLVMKRGELFKNTLKNRV